MPSRQSVLVIFAFWLVTLGVVVRRDVWPRVFSSGPPPVSVDVGDEASPLLPSPWSIYRGNTRVGRLNTRATYSDADNTYVFTHEYSSLLLDAGGVMLIVPRLTTVTNVARDGSLRGQSLDGNLELNGGGLRFQAKLNVAGRVVGGQFVGTCEFTSDLLKLKRDLAPAPVPNGHALNPLQVVNRITGIRPRQEWVVHVVDPLSDAVALLVREQLAKAGVTLPEKKREPLVAQVSATTQEMKWKDEPVPCWVIEYRDAEVKARTWVRASDGKVLKQEAFDKGEHLTVLRDE